MSQGASPGELSPMSPTGQDTPGPGPGPGPGSAPTLPIDPGRIRRNTACVRCRDAKVRPVPLSSLPPPWPRSNTPYRRSSAMPAPPQAGPASGAPSWGLTASSTKATSERRGGGSFPASNECCRVAVASSRCVLGFRGTLGACDPPWTCLTVNVDETDTARKCFCQ
jgi:hypothetical protein